MAVESHRLAIQTRGNTDIVNLTSHVHDRVASGSITDGIATLCVIGSTAALSTTEYEPGLVQTDLEAALERLAPENGHYQHEATWHDDNGHSHVRASLVGSSLTVPLIGGQLTLGTWQQIILMDFDTRPRNREIVIQVIGDG